jgi:RNA polymerase sigma-70 factor (ECF subfamily)
VDEDLEQSLNDAWESGRAAWPDVELALPLFADYLRDRLPAGATPAALAAMRCADLYLACACAMGAPGALQSFERILMARVPDFVRRLDSSPEFADEVCQVLREKLFVASETGAKISTYQGAAPLVHWLRVAALNTAIKVAARHRPERNLPIDEVTVTALEEQDPELDYLKAQYRDQFQTAVRAAMGELSTQQRRVLRLHLSARLSTPQIGALLRVHHSTVVRWLAAARENIRDTVRRRLKDQLGLDSAEFDSISGLLLSRLDLSIESCLRESEADPAESL